MNTRQHSHHRKGQNAEHPVSSEPLRLVPTVSFVSAVVFIIIGVLICILNIINVIYGPWAPIIGIIFAGIGLIVAFYAVFIGTRKGGEIEKRL
jgi:hypothetical protein